MRLRRNCSLLQANTPNKRLQNISRWLSCLSSSEDCPLDSNKAPGPSRRQDASRNTSTTRSPALLCCDGLARVGAHPALYKHRPWLKSELAAANRSVYRHRHGRKYLFLTSYSPRPGTPSTLVYSVSLDQRWALDTVWAVISWA